MYPNQPQPLPPSPPPTPAPVDYLNQIAPQAPQKSSWNKKIQFIGIIGGGLIIFVIALAITIGAISGAQREPAQTFAARLAASQRIADTAQKNLKSSQLRSINSDLRLFFTNTSRDIATPLAAFGVSSDTIPDRITTNEDTLAKGTSTRLEDARLNAVFDRTYAREMAFQLSTMIALLQQMYNAAPDKNTQTFLDTTYRNLQPIQQGFADFNELS
jgi:hypothetical protein